MGRSTESDGIRKGRWAPEEDQKLIDYINNNGHIRNWIFLPKLAGLNRCGKSCRLRWINYLRPGIKRGKFSDHEDKLIVKLHSLLGNKWSAIATHLPGRTDNEIKNHWNTHLRKKLLQMGIDPVTHRPRIDHHINLFNALIENLPPQLLAAAASSTSNFTTNSSIKQQLDMNTLTNFLFPDTDQLIHQIQLLQNSSLLVTNNSLISNANSIASSPSTTLNQIFGSQNNLCDPNQLQEYNYNSVLTNYQQFLSNNNNEDSIFYFSDLNNSSDDYKGLITDTNYYDSSGKNDQEINVTSTEGRDDQLMVKRTGNVITGSDQILRNIISTANDFPDEIGITRHDNFPERPSRGIEMPKQNMSNIYPKQDELIMLQPSSASTTWGQIMIDEDANHNDSYWRDFINELASRSSP